MADKKTLLPRIMLGALLLGLTVAPAAILASEVRSQAPLEPMLQERQVRALETIAREMSLARRQGCR